MGYKNILLSFKKDVAVIQFKRDENKNTINQLMIDELFEAVEECENRAKIVIFEGNEEYFCFGADFNCDEPGTMKEGRSLFDLLLKISEASFVSICYVLGRTNAGGMGFVACCDIVIASETATFSLSELLFGLYPAMVIPFLKHKIGCHHMNYMVLMTKPFSAKEAFDFGIVDCVSEKPSLALGQHIARIKKIPADAIRNYKKYVSILYGTREEYKTVAIEENKNIFSDKENQEKIRNFVKNGIYPWEM